jgi:hypothetical protein
VNLPDGGVVFPSDVLNPISSNSEFEVITENTHGIHWWTNYYKPEVERKRDLGKVLNSRKYLKPILGEKAISILDKNLGLFEKGVI